MSNVIAQLNKKILIISALGLLASGAGILAPRVSSTARAEADCTPIYSQAILNPSGYGAYENPGNCQQYPFMEAKVIHADGSSSIYSQNSVSAQPGDIVQVALYVHNGAASNSGSIATGERLSATADSVSASSHSLGATVTSNNAGSLNGNVNVITSGQTTLQYVAGSAQWFQSQTFEGYLGSPVNSSVGLPDQQPCFQYERFIYYQFKVVATQQNPTGTINGQISGQVSGQCLSNGVITWSTQNAPIVQIYVTNPDTGTQTLFASNVSGTQNAPWIAPGKSYLFTLYNVVNGQKQQLAQTTLMGPALSCGTPPTLTLAVSSDSYCVYSKGEHTNDTPLYTVTGSSGLAGQNLYWAASLNNQSKDSNFQNGQLNGNGYANVYGGTWNTSQIGSWTVSVHTANSAVVSNSKSFIVKDCSTTTATLSCSANPSSANVNQTVSFNAAGGNGSFSWSGDTGFANSLSGQSINTSYSSSGTKFVTVASGGQTAECSVNINIVPTPTPVATFTASATASASANATASCADGTTATASASATASATATSSISQQDAQNKAQSQAYAQAYAQAHASAEAKAVCTVPTPTPTPTPPVCKQLTFNPNTSTISTTSLNPGDSFTVTCDYGAVTNSVKVSGVSCDQNPTFNGTKASFNCSAPTTPGSYPVSCNLQSGTSSNVCSQTNSVGSITVSNPNHACVANSNYSLNVVNLTQVGSTYTATVQWSSTGGHNIKITSNGSTLTSGSDTGSFVVTGLQPGQIYTFAMVDISCNVTLTTATVNIPNITPTPTPTPASGNCNGSSNSCNNNTNTNTNTNNNSTNSSNQNNNNNINGNNNTVSNSNENCVNNSCNTYFITTAGNTVPFNQFSQLSITKLVRDVTANNSSFQHSVSANNNDTVQFQITVTNTGGQTAQNVMLTDNLPSGLTFLNGSLSYSGAYPYSPNIYNNISLGSLSQGQSITVTFEASVNNFGGSTNLQNTATATASNVSSVQDTAWVFVNGQVSGGNVNLVYSKSAYNNTKNINAVSQAASLGDQITYTLTVTNNGNVQADNFVITDDLSQVLPYSTLTDNGGGSMNGNTISFPGITVPAGGSVSKSFQVTVKNTLASNLNYQMSNTYGNSIVININTPQVLGAFTAPKTGADSLALTFSTFLTAGFAVFKKRKDWLKLIFN